MAGVSSVGVGSGLDLESLLTNLVNAERVPTETRLAAREAGIQANVSAFGNLKSALAKFQTSLAGLRDAESLRAPSASSGDATLFSASARGGAAVGQYSVQVLNLARAQKLASADFASGTATVGSGTLAISSGDDNFDVEVIAGTTLAGLRDAINSASGNSSVTASLLTVDDGLGGGGTVTKLLLSARSTGEDNAIEIAVSDDDTQNSDDQGLSRFFFAANDPLSQLEEIEEAQDARISVDGFTAYSNTNSFVDVIDGVTLTALREPENVLDPESATLTIGLNKSIVSARIQEFVKAYNDARATIRDLTRFDQATGAAGQLLGDATVRNIDVGLRRIIGDTVESSEKFSSLASLGIVSQRDGSLTVNSSKLNAALESDFDDVVNLFAAEDDGAANRFAVALDNYLDTGGVIRARTDGFDKQLKDIDNQREALALRITAIEARYRQQFIALDQLVTRLQSSGDFLLSQLENTSKIITGKRS